MGITTQIIGLIASLSILVLIHELGHYLFARLFKTRVEKFYLFFNPYFSILRVKKINGRWEYSFLSTKSPQEWADYKDSTEWGIGWLPLGGYCSIAGMVDETTSADKLSAEIQPWEFRAKPAWQRFFIIAGGVLVNFLSALLIYSLVMFSWGKEYIPLENAKYGLHFSEAAIHAGFKNGDKIISVDGKQPIEMSDLIKMLLVDNPKEVVVLRDNKQETIHLKKDNWKKLLGPAFCQIDIPFVIEEVMYGEPAEKAGLRSGDSLVGINDEQVYLFFDIQETFAKNSGKEVVLHYYRDDELMQTPLTLTSQGKIGVQVKFYTNFLETKKEHYTFWQSIPKGINLGIDRLTFYVKQMKRVFSREGVTQIGGFGTIGKIFPKTWDWEQFWSSTAFLSVILAFMNIIPIPALDGGYIMFILVELITKRKPSDKFIGYANMVGFALLITLLLYANGMDVVRWLFR